MIRFLPDKNKKEIQIEYFSRVFVLSLIFLSFLGTIAAFTLFPAYIVAFYRDASIETQAESVQSNWLDVSEQERMVKIMNEIISALSKFEDKSPSVPMLHILEKQNNDIKINGILYTNTKGQFDFTIKGVSLTREGLLSFVRDLKADKSLSGVNLPVSDFVKSTDIDFSITLSSK